VRRPEPTALRDLPSAEGPVRAARRSSPATCISRNWVTHMCQAPSSARRGTAPKPLEACSPSPCLLCGSGAWLVGLRAPFLRLRAATAKRDPRTERGSGPNHSVSETRRLNVRFEEAAGLARCLIAKVWSRLPRPGCCVCSSVWCGFRRVVLSWVRVSGPSVPLSIEPSCACGDGRCRSGRTRSPRHGPENAHRNRAASSHSAEHARRQLSFGLRPVPSLRSRV
jgi:hypothetical protein